MALPIPEEEEDDYLTMTIPDPTITVTKTSNKKPRETLTEKTRRLAREREAKAHPKSKAELAAEAKRKREEGLARNILLATQHSGKEGNDDGEGTTAATAKNKGAAMMAKLGYIPGMPLGKKQEPANPGQGRANGDTKRDVNDSSEDTRLLEPIGISEREDKRAGIGADAERKRKIREEFDRVANSEKRVKVELEGYRERQAREREEARREGQLKGAMGIAEMLEEEEENEEEAGRDVAGKTVRVRNGRKRRRLQDINVLWRGLVKQRAIRERDRRMRYDLHQSLSARADYNDPEEEDRVDRLALGKDTEEVDAEELDRSDDEELNAFEALDVSVRLERVVMYLRERWGYCFWCKHRYEEEGMEGCPGVREEDHD